MKVVCVDNEIHQGFKFTVTCNGERFYFKHPLTIGSIYDVLGEYDKTYLILDDDICGSKYNKTLFITLQEYRENILNNLILK